MCTAISDNLKGHFLARTLDVERSYGERILGVGRKFPFSFLREETVSEHPFILGIGIESEGYPLFFDAVNERGLAVAGLNFPDSARYHKARNGKTNVASFEFIPFVLSKCQGVGEARELLRDVNVTDDGFSTSLCAAPLHWIIADRDECIVAEPLSDGLRVYENPLGVLTNEPPFPLQSKGCEEYTYSSRECFSSRARFCRAQYVKSHTRAFSSSEGVSRMLSIMDTVRVPYACSSTPTGEPTYTAYTSCADTQNCVYYVREHSRFSVGRVEMGDFDFGASALRTLNFCHVKQIM